MSKYIIISRNQNQSYGIYQLGPGLHRIVKNLKDYSDEQEAIGDLIKLLDGELTERDLVGSSFEQEVEAGKLGNRILVLEAALKRVRHKLSKVIDSGVGDLKQVIRELIQDIDGLVEG
ncbi:MAG TPA: hypothetical protein PLD49_08910 [Thermoclostridium caenicola]|uniref:hypothetical protein n=1 Tax=Thermoclostridium caenicola TaxID=659425 RepID=UPI002CD003E6|nr:hypothetical protein [Thermoclostridium caenicola]HOK43771.1 hypothetical protein [Thermoclostridium caenicola]HOL85642.1 hypothetical protein [Thermoclostridium caenicola]HPO76389.1 hypothetical protein [Thermoclostridium caenicola]